MVNSIKVVLLALVAVLALPTLADDATSVTLNATVLNQGGDALPGATVRIKSDATGLTRQAVSNASGQVRFPQLPVGEYNVSVSSGGYDRLDDEVMVMMGSGSSYDFVLRATGATMEEVVVTARSGVIPNQDFNSTTTGISLDVDEIFETVPMNRSVTNLVLLAPGTAAGDGAFGSLASISGSSVAENNYLVNGLNITNFRNFTGSSTVPFEFLRVVEVKTGGYAAEFGKAIGGVVNTVTKSGTNDFEAGINVNYYPEMLYNQGKDTFVSQNSKDERDFLDYNVYVSGPIIKDKLFYFLLANPVDNSTINPSFSGRSTVASLQEEFFGGKIDYFVTDRIHAEYTYFTDKSTSEFNDYAFDNDSGDQGGNLGTSFSNAGGDNHIAKISAALTDQTTIALTWGKNEYERTSFGTGDAYNFVWWPFPTQQIGRASNLVVSAGADEREIFRFDADFYFGNHHIRAGLEVEDLTSSDITGYSGPGNLYYRGYDDDDSGTIDPGETVRVRVYKAGGEFDIEQTAIYIQDSWDVTDRLNLNFGIRRSTFNNKNAGGETFVKTEDQDALRLGATFDLTGDGSSKVYASYGEYYLPIAANTNIRMSGTEFFTQQFCSWDGTLDANEVPGVEDCGALGVFGDGSIPDTRSLTDNNLEPMYGDEYILGYSKNFDSGALEGWSLNTYYQRRTLASTIEDVAIDAAVNAYCEAGGGNEDGCAEFTGFHQYVLTNPGTDMSVYIPEFDETINLSAEDLRYPEPVRNYDGITLELEKPYDGNWGLSFSYTRSSSRGNYEGTVKSDNGQDDAGITQDFDQPGLVDGSYGKLPNHRDHIAKLFGTKSLATNITAGLNMSVTSPRKYGCIGVHPTDVYAQAYGASSWYCGGKLTPRASQAENDWLVNLDFMLSWNVPVPTGELTLRLDIFNIFNSEKVVDLYEFGELSNGAPDSDYLEPTVYQTPRRTRLGFSYRF